MGMEKAPQRIVRRATGQKPKFGREKKILKKIKKSIFLLISPP